MLMRLPTFAGESWALMEGEAAGFLSIESAAGGHCRLVFSRSPDLETISQLSVSLSQISHRPPICTIIHSYLSVSLSVSLMYDYRRNIWLLLETDWFQRCSVYWAFVNHIHKLSWWCVCLLLLSFHEMNIKTDTQWRRIKIVLRIKREHD